MKKEPITWLHKRRKISELKPAAYNPRKMTEEEERDLGESIDEFGAVIPIVVNIGKRDGVLIGGHQRTKIYEKKGIEEVDTIEPSRELTVTEEKRLNLRLNKNTGSWDPEKLKDMDLTMLLDVGFGDEELQVFFDDVDVIDDEFNVGRAVKEIKTPTAKPGEVWQLGEHRLMCGDSTDPVQVAKLMAGDKADVIYCDPPYNIGLDYTKGVTTEGKYGGNYSGKKDSKKDGEYAAFVDATLKNALENAKPNAHAFYWCDERYIWLIQTLFAENKIKNQRVCLWVKNNFNMTPQVAFNKAYEPCVYGVTGKPFLNKNIRNLNEILNKEIESGNQVHEEILDMITLWLDKREDTTRYEHPTQKPITLAEKPLKRCSAPGHIIIDLFGGSGSTLIACEIFKLGDHILGCGSSTDKEFVKKVVGDRKIRMILTDPPYGVAYVEGKKDFNKLGTENVKEIMNDHLQTDVEYRNFTKEWLEAVSPYLESYNAAYIFNSDLMYPALRAGMEAAGFYYSQGLVWIKNSVVIGRKDYLPMHELVAYGWYGRHKFERPKAKSILLYPKPSASKLHPTMKPVGLLRKIIPNSTKIREWVYDPFGGSGSTLIASEHLGRKCVMIELDPSYVSTIIARWEKLTNGKAKKI